MNVHILGHKKKICDTCGQPAHPFTTRCDYNTLVRRIGMLLETNSHIPGILQSNKEALQVALDYESMMKQAAKALSIAEEVVKEEGVVGELIWNKFQERLDAWLKTLPPDTAANPNLSSPESTPPSESVDKPSTEATILGADTAPDSSLLIQNAMRVEKEPPLLIT